MIKIFKNLGRYWQRRRDRLYFKSRWNLIFDISLGIIIIILIATLIFLSLYKPDLGDIFKPTALVIEEKYNLDINNPPLDFNFSEPKVLRNINEETSLSLAIRNNSPVEIKDIKISFLPTDKNFYIDSLKISSENQTEYPVKISGSQVVINNIASSGRQEVDLTISWKTRAGADKAINWQAQVEYFVNDQLVKEVFDMNDILIASQLKGEAMVYYHSPQGDQLGSGPLPPLVSLPTNYWAFFNVKSDGVFKNLVFSAKLAPGVELTDNRSLLAGNFSYNPSLRQIIWTVPEIQADNDSYRLSFEIQFIPTENQLGEKPTLLTDLKYYAHDPILREESYYSLDGLNTNLDKDLLNSGQGEVSLP